MKFDFVKRQDILTDKNVTYVIGTPIALLFLFT